jgi:uncharacterized protein with HEPN domain
MTIHPGRADDYLLHILEAIDRAAAYAQKAGTAKAFEQDVLLQDGIIRNIGVIGEAAVRIAQSEPGLVAKYPTVPWREMQTMRHKLVHDYFDVDLSIVWDTCSMICRSSLFKSRRCSTRSRPVGLTRQLKILLPNLGLRASAFSYISRSPPIIRQPNSALRGALT